MSSPWRMGMMNNETELPEHVRRNRLYWDRLAAEYAGPGGTRLGAPGTDLGHLAGAGRRAPRVAGGSRWQGRDRTRLRHGVHRGMARPPRGTCGRDRRALGPPHAVRARGRRPRRQRPVAATGVRDV